MTTPYQKDKDWLFKTIVGLLLSGIGYLSWDNSHVIHSIDTRLSVLETKFNILVPQTKVSTFNVDTSNTRQELVYLKPAEVELKNETND